MTQLVTVPATPRHPALELLARYAAVFGAAWAARRELVGPARLADEAAFLPAALSLQETPVHPAPRRAAIAICALFVIALVWAIVGEIDIVAVAPERIVVSGNTKIVQPLETSVVKAIHVKDGDRVAEGQLLIELDATGAAADRGSIPAQAEAAAQDVHRAQALLRALQGGAAPAGDAVTVAEWRDIAAKRARYEAERQRREAERQRREAELATAREMLAKLQAMLPLAQQREADIQSLAGQGFVAGHAGQDRTRERIEIERDLATQQARVAETQAAMTETAHAHEAYVGL